MENCIKPVIGLLTITTIIVKNYSLDRHICTFGQHLSLISVQHSYLHPLEVKDRSSDLAFNGWMMSSFCYNILDLLF